jgi:RNA polymerase sigma-70 factor, ECF subfamily
VPGPTRRDAAGCMRLELIERARNGDREAFGRLAAGEIERLLAIARLVLRDSYLAEDAVQEALVRCWRQLPTLRETSAFDAWLSRILMRAATDEVARRRRHESAIRSIRVEPAVADGAAHLAERDELERGFLKLSLDHRAVLVLHHYAGLSLTEVAASLEIPQGTAKSRYHYAMAALRAELEAEDRLATGGEVTA